MARTSNAEQQFTTRYPNFNLRKGVTHPFEVYVGDYVCSEARTRTDAFRIALRETEAGNITPADNEFQTEGFEVTLAYGAAARR